MSESLPSLPTTIIDVPAVRDFKAVFQYNFFVPDEGVNPDGGVPYNVLQLPADAFDSARINQLATRVPRFVLFTFTPPVIPPMNNTQDDNSVRDNRFGKARTPKNYIQSNLAKVLDEDFFASQNFTAINLNDQSIEKKLYNLVSGTAVFMTEDISKGNDLTHKQLALAADQLTSNQVDFQFLSKFLVQPSENNTFFFEQNGNKILNSVTERLKNVDIHVQVNNKFLHNIVNNAITNPNSTYSSDYIQMYAVSKVTKNNALQQTNSDMLQDDYKTSAQYVDVCRDYSNTSTVSGQARVVGYIIDKVEILPNGQHNQLPPIVVEAPFVHTTIDYEVKYYASYVYSIRTVAEFTIPSIIENTNELAVAKFLISSPPSRQINVSCIDQRPPPPPVDVDFHWDYDKNSLGVTWNFPPTPERDVKKFQVFRRKTIGEPFQLLMMYDMDDSQMKATFNERIPANLITKSLSPTRVFIDVDFSKTSKYIYALCSIDAHGQTSNYSEQFEISFDAFKNQLVKTRVSSSGAPKSYPNMYLDAQSFVNAMIDTNHKQVTIAFNPEYLGAFDSQGRDLKLLTTSRDDGSYQLRFINTDLQKEQVLKINVSDLRKFPDVRNRFVPVKVLKPAT